MSIKWIWSDSYSIDGPSGPSDKGRPHAELFHNVGNAYLSNAHIDKGFTQNGSTYTTEFYKIPKGCHAIVQLNNPDPKAWVEGYTSYYLQAPLFIPIEWTAGVGGLLDANGRYRRNSVIFCLELAWAKFADNKQESENITDWKYENIHILNPAMDTANHLKYYDAALTMYGQFSHGGVWAKYTPISNYKLMWGNLHLYNFGNLDLYCKAIDLGLWYDD